MDATEREKLLQDLAAGRTSRNRSFQRFSDPGAWRVLVGHRRVEHLAREAARDDADVAVLRGGDGRVHAVTVRRARLGYRREMILLDWEADLLVRRHPWIDAWPGS